MKIKLKIYVGAPVVMGIINQPEAMAAEGLQDGLNAFYQGDYSRAAQALEPWQDNSANAQFALGSMYLSGQGVPQDDTRAENLLTKSARAGNVDTQFQLGLIYLDVDNDVAYEWLSKADDGGHNQAPFILKRMMTGEFTDAC